jgi:hypothetical protein
LHSLRAENQYNIGRLTLLKESFPRDSIISCLAKYIPDRFKASILKDVCSRGHVPKITLDEFTLYVVAEMMFQGRELAAHKGRLRNHFISVKLFMISCSLLSLGAILQFRISEDLHDSLPEQLI